MLFRSQCIAIEKPEGDISASGGATPKNTMKLLESYDDGSVFSYTARLGGIALLRPHHYFTDTTKMKKTVQWRMRKTTVMGFS